MIRFKVGKKYSREDVGYVCYPKEGRPKGGDWDTGYVRFNNNLIIFMNIGIPGRTGHDFPNDFNLETRIHSEDRCHRIGQAQKVNYIDLVTEGTVDEHIVKILQNKMKLAGQALGEEVRKWLNDKASDRSLIKT